MWKSRLVPSGRQNTENWPFAFSHVANTPTYYNSMTWWCVCRRFVNKQAFSEHVFVHLWSADGWIVGCFHALRAPPSIFLCFHFCPVLHVSSQGWAQCTLTSLSFISLPPPCPILPNSFHTMCDTLLFGLTSKTSAKWPDRIRSIHHSNHVA